MSSGIPERIGPYEIGEPAGTSVMGALFSSRNPDTGDPLVVAIAHDAQSGIGHTMRMRREALALLKLSHPNLLSILDVGALHGRLYVIMERTPGQPLDRVLAQRRHSWREILALYISAGRGLAAAHGRAVVHGSISPACIRVADDGRVALTDFALLRDPQRSGATTPPSQELAARSRYTAPERTLGAPATVYSDQFSFATSLAESLRLDNRWRRLGIPIAIERALRHARADDPRERYASMYELLHELQPPAVAVTPGRALALALALMIMAGITAAAGC